MNKKRQRKPKFEDLNRAMSKWFEQMMEKGAQVNGPILLEKAQQFAIQLNIPDFKANPGWLQRWKKNENIQFRKRHGEAASADAESAINFKENIAPTLLARYSLDNIYNADETGLLYKALPNGSYSYGSTQMSGLKIPKDRITLLFITNASGSDKYVYSIGKYKQPRCFRGKTIPISYKHNKKAWMTSATWCEILKEMNEKFKKLNKNIVLLIDNASCHKLDFTPENIEIVFLPPCTTSLIQPLDQGRCKQKILNYTIIHKLFLFQGIIQSFKAHYRKILIREQILAIEGDCMDKFLKNITVLKALHIIKRSWWLVTPQTITNCFRKCGIFIESESNEPEISEILLGSEYNSFLEDMSDLEKRDCFGTLSDDEIINDVLEQDLEEEEEEVSSTIFKPKREEVIQALFILKQYLDSDADNNIFHIENILYKQRDESLVQKKIMDYFQSK